MATKQELEETVELLKQTVAMQQALIASLQAQLAVRPPAKLYPQPWVPTQPYPPQPWITYGPNTGDPMPPPHQTTCHLRSVS